jgi:prepilin-type N-terminal cleavage/methylation domain-containing protein
MTRPPIQRRDVAFTLIELLIVISIFVLLLAIAVPAFSSMLYSSEQSMAENALRTGIAAARDAAIRSAQGEDAAAVFFYDYRTGRESILPCVYAGTIKDDCQPRVTCPRGARGVRPRPGFEPVQLPRGWSARGYAPRA